LCNFERIKTLYIFHFVSLAGWVHLRNIAIYSRVFLELTCFMKCWAKNVSLRTEKRQFSVQYNRPKKKNFEQEISVPWFLNRLILWRKTSLCNADVIIRKAFSKIKCHEWLVSFKSSVVFIKMLWVNWSEQIWTDFFPLTKTNFILISESLSSWL
jgi:hypothetical protein